MESCLHHKLQKMRQSHDAAFGFGRGVWEKPSLHLEYTSGLLATAAAVIQGTQQHLPVPNFSPYIERPSMQGTPPCSLTGRSHWLSQQDTTGEEVLEFPVTQSTSHISANDHTSEGCCRFRELRGVLQSPACAGRAGWG